MLIIQNQIMKKAFVLSVILKECRAGPDRYMSMSMSSKGASFYSTSSCTNLTMIKAYRKHNRFSFSDGKAQLVFTGSRDGLLLVYG